MKKTLRENMIQKLTTLDDVTRTKIESAMLHHFVQSNIWKEATTIGVTISHEFEWNTRDLIRFLWRKGKTVAVPKVDPPTNSLTFYKLNDFTELSVGYANILEPDAQIRRLVPTEQIDLLIVPGIVFNVKGYRIGFGGGYYDRLLVHYHKKTLSLVSEEQIIDHLPIEAHDIPVQYMLTEKRLWNTLHP